MFTNDRKTVHRDYRVKRFIFGRKATVLSRFTIPKTRCKRLRFDRPGS